MNRRRALHERSYWNLGVELPAMARRVLPRAKGRDVYVYLDNDARVRAPFDARTLRAVVDRTEVPLLPAVLAEAGEPAREKWPVWARRVPPDEPDQVE